MDGGEKRIDLYAVSIYAGVCEKRQQQVNPKHHCMPFWADCQLCLFRESLKCLQNSTEATSIASCIMLGLNWYTRFYATWGEECRLIRDISHAICSTTDHAYHSEHRIPKIFRDFSYKLRNLPRRQMGDCSNPPHFVKLLKILDSLTVRTTKIRKKNGESRACDEPLRRVAIYNEKSVVDSNSDGSVYHAVCAFFFIKKGFNTKSSSSRLRRFRDRYGRKRVLQKLSRHEAL